MRSLVTGSLRKMPGHRTPSSTGKGLIIPWSQVRVLAGPPSSYNSWRYGILRPGDHSPLVCPIERRLDGAFRGVFDEGQYLNRADSTEVTG